MANHVLISEHYAAFQNECYWILSNIAAGTPKQAESLVNRSDILEFMSGELRSLHCDESLKKEVSNPFA
jgi:hypothetical protein